MADNTIGVHIQGVSDEGNPVEDGYPVVVAFEGPDGTKEVPNIGPSGGVIVEPAPGGPHSVVDQGLPNAGGALSWSVAPQDRVLHRSSGTLIAAGDTVSIDCTGSSAAWISVNGSFSAGEIIVNAVVNGQVPVQIAFFSELFGTPIFAVRPTTIQDILGVGVSAWDRLDIVAGPGFIGTPSMSVTAASGPGTDVINLGSSISLATIVGLFPKDGEVGPATSTTFTDDAANNGFVSTYQTTIPQYCDGVRLQNQRTPSNFKTAFATAAGSTALWAPAAGKKFRLMRYMVAMTEQAVQAAGGTFTVKLLDGAAGIGQEHDIFVPGVAFAGTGDSYVSPWIDLGNGILSSAANNVLNINLPAALTAGQVRVLCCGTEE